MATIEPFTALRPRPDLAARICELPYDVMSSDEARELAASNPLSFLHISKPEIDFPPGQDATSPKVYARGRDNFIRLISEGYLKQDPHPRLYLYRQRCGDHVQTGVVGCVRCEEYLTGIIRKHELTRPDKEADRVRHIEALNAQTGPAFLAYRASRTIDGMVARKVTEPPDVDFTAPDGVQHTAWAFIDGEISKIRAEFGRVPCFYIADGHHRSAAAVKVWENRKRNEGSAGFLAVIFPHNQLQILPYHRVIKDLNGNSVESVLAKLQAACGIAEEGESQPNHPRELGFYLAGRWRKLILRDSPDSGQRPEQNLDVALLQEKVLKPVFGIDDPRTSKRIQFVGGIRGTAELARMVDSGECACAFSLFPTRIEDLMAVADAGGLMPPKSTWFEPKLRDAMFCHLL